MKLTQLKKLLKHIILEVQKNEMIANKDYPPDVMGAVNVEQTGTGAVAGFSPPIGKKKVKESNFENKLKARLKSRLKEKTNPDGTYSDDMPDAIRMKHAEGLSEMTTSSAAGGQAGGTISVPAWGTKNKEGSPRAIAATKKMKGWTVAKSISTEGK